jgi:predicted protein tyrosine phosphatase
MQKSRGLKNLTPEFVAGLMCIAVVLRQMQEERESQNLLGFASSETDPNARILALFALRSPVKMSEEVPHKGLSYK